MVATFASMRQFVGVALEATQGTAVPMTNTLLVEKLDWGGDKPKWLDDKSWRGWMTTVAGRQQGPIVNEFSMNGLVLMDNINFLLANLFGDVVPAGTASTPSTTLAAAVSTPTAGSPVTQITTTASIPAGSTILIDTGNLAEVRKTGTPSGAGPYTIPFAAGERSLIYAHANSAPVVVQVAPYTSAYSLLNSGPTAVYAQGQPPSHTITHYQGVSAGTGARVFPGACCSELTLKFNAESEYLTFDSKWTSWPSSIAAATPTSAPSSVLPIASWRGALGIGGPASGGTLVKNVASGEITFKRKLEPDFTVQGAQTPYIIQRGELESSGKFDFVAADESPYLNMINNTQPQHQFVINNGLSGASQLQLQWDIAACSYKATKPESGKAAIHYAAEWDAIANTTNAGGSGGGSPGKLTVINAVAPNIYM